MSSNLLFNFKVDKSASTVFVDKEFDAELSLVWDAFTKQEILDQWWAPRPWVSKTKYMDFKVGGRRFYAMVSPEGEAVVTVKAPRIEVPEVEAPAAAPEVAPEAAPETEQAASESESAG